MTDESGYTDEELARGEDEAWHIPIWGCLLVVGVVIVGGWLIFG